MWGIFLLLVLVFFVWIRDEIRNAPIVDDDPISPHAGFCTRKEMQEEDDTTPERTAKEALNLTFDVEFNEKHPCDYQSPYILPDGSKTFVCSCIEMWKEVGIMDDVLASLNDGAKEQCARCIGLRCKGRKKHEEQK